MPTLKWLNSAEDFKSLAVALHRKLVNISKEIAAERKHFPVSTEKLKRLKESRKEIDRSYSFIQNAIKENQLNPDDYSKHLKLYQSH
jgi:septal ring factor EnvC (AmiA/AmiB activator)